MVVLAVFLVSFMVFGGLGAFGVEAFSTWRDAGAWAIAAMLFLTASVHFTRTREDFVKMIPDIFRRRVSSFSPPEYWSSRAQSGFSSQRRGRPRLFASRF